LATEERVNRPLLFVLRHVPWLIAAAILAGAALLMPALRSREYWLSLGELYFAPAALALVLTPIVLTGGIDLSVGSVAVFVSVVIGCLLRDLHWSIPAALAAGVAAGFLAGLLNGGLVTLGVVPLVATLATRELFRGLAYTVGGETSVTGLPKALEDVWTTSIFGLPLPLVVVGVLFAATYAVTHHTWFGRMVFAVGDNETAARFAGVPVRRLKLGLYAASGLVVGLCGVALVLRFGTARAGAEKALELTAIACVVLGGIRITGGAGNVAGTLLGIATVAALLTTLSQVPPNYRDMVLGALVIAVAVINEAARRWADRLSLMEKD
jgi:ribose/xylose/arabinose/galactoside ABC-type transport system permease subunit